MSHEQVRIVHVRLKTAQSRQKSYYDQHHQEVHYEVGKKAYPRVTPQKGVHRFGIKGKLAPRYVGRFTILAKQGELPYQLKLPSTFPEVHDVFHVSQLKCCFKDLINGVDHKTLDLQEDVTYREYPVCTLMKPSVKKWRQSIKFLRVQWSHHFEQEATWEQEDCYPAFFPKT
jgi:hypothetical protein